MYPQNFLQKIKDELAFLQKQAKFKYEHLITSPMGPEVTVDGKTVLMFASNNYLGLANHQEVVNAAREGLEKYGYGLSSVRFICGTLDIHRGLEKKIAEFLGVDDAILYSSCFMANAGFFASFVNEPLGTKDYQDVIYSDELNHASIIDAFKLCKKEQLVKRIYPHIDLKALENMLHEDADKGYRNKFLVCDGVFSMEGELAPLPQLVELAQKHSALLFVDDAHGMGMLGKTGAGTPEELGVHGKIDVVSGTLGKALGGALGGYVAGKKEIIDFLRQKSRTYLFSNSLPPSVVFASLKVLEILRRDLSLVKKVQKNSAYFRERIKGLGFKTLEGKHAVVPVFLGEANVAQEMSRKLFEAGLYVVGLWFPVVPEGTARLRFQVSAAHTQKHLDQALEILQKVGREVGII